MPVRGLAPNPRILLIALAANAIPLGPASAIRASLDSRNHAIVALGVTARQVAARLHLRAERQVLSEAGQTQLARQHDHCAPVQEKEARPWSS